jgi:stage II sporulation protein E
VLEACGKKGGVELQDIPDGLASKCEHLDRLLPGVSAHVDDYQAKLERAHSQSEGRKLLSQQLSGVSTAIKQLSSDISSSLNFKEDLEERILQALAKANIEVDRVTVIENASQRYEVIIRHKLCYDKKRWNRTVSRSLSLALGRDMEAEDSEKSLLYRTRFVEARPVKLQFGLAKLAKGRKGESGDSYSFMQLPNGETLLALSDGMGSGRRAREESTAAVDLLENFLQAGFDKDLALQIINSALVLKNTEENFATLDICTIDNYSGEAEFVKIGAASTFLLRDGKVYVIRSTSLPIGMLTDVDMEISKKKLENKDVLLMVTDGLLDIADTYGDKEDWIANALRACDHDKAQDIADFILLEAQRLCAGVIRDDMTVLAATIKM